MKTSSHLPIAVLWCIAGLISFATKPANAQKVANYDYADAKPADRLRPPQPARMNPHQLQAGVCGGILSNSPLVVSILSLDRGSYAFGDEFTFVLEIRAIYPTWVPVRGSLREIEPSDPKLSYQWRPMGITTELRSPNNRTAYVSLLELYGSKDAPGSEVELNAGEWIELRGKARMGWSNPPRSEEKSVLRVPLQHEQQFTAFALAHRAGSNLFNAATKQESRVCDYPGEQSGSGKQIDLTVTPKIRGLS